jgi:phosphoglycerol transferase MdoB-like AlkP superfamily enzyme
MTLLAQAPVAVSLEYIRASRWPVRRLGPYSPLLGFLLLAVVALSACRIALIAWQWPRVDLTDSLLPMLLQGLRSDLMTIGLCAAPVTLVLPLFIVARAIRSWIVLCSVWLSACLVFILFLELATPQFLLEYDARPNQLFVEYLAYPRQVFTMLWQTYPALLIGTALGVAALSWVTYRHFRKYVGNVTAWRPGIVMLVWPCVAIVLFVMIRSSMQHRPANLATFAFCDDAMVNSLVANSAYTVFSAVYSMREEGASSEMYGSMPHDEMVKRVQASMGVAPSDFGSADRPTLRHQIASVTRAKPANLIIVLEESLGAGFVERLGGINATPQLEALADQGIWFEHLYATGTRSVRGIEAVIAGFPPTPALSVLKLPKSQRDFATLASVLRGAGYHNEFVYGGESHFDNMRGFFLNNGFQSVTDRHDFSEPKFVGSWGASDEDLFAMAEQRLTKLNEDGERFFMLVFSSSNHMPFEFPDGRIELIDAEKQTVNNAVKYADYALGKFVTQVRASRYWDNTVMMIVADHDTRVYGDELVPVRKFQIPGLILGNGIEPRKIDSIASQIDLAPTLLSLIGVDATHPFPGRDLTRTLPEFGNASPAVAPRAMMQFDRNFAWLEGNQVTVLQPNGIARAFTYDPHAFTLEPSATDPESVRTALAQVLMPAWLYREQRYSLEK